MANHFRALAIRDNAEYLAWCRAHGFAETLAKRPKQKSLELAAFSREHGATALFFFINNPMLDFARIGAAVDYLHNR